MMIMYKFLSFDNNNYTMTSYSYREPLHILS